MLGNVYHMGYNTDDAEAAAAFFEKAFGGKILKRTTGADGKLVIFVKAGDAEFELMQPADITELDGKAGLVFDHVGYAVTDLDKEMADLKAKGVRFATAAPTVNAFGYRMIFLDGADSLGTRIHLTEIKS